MGPLFSRAALSTWLPANLILAALVAFLVLASSVEGDLRRVSRVIDPDLRRPPAGAAEGAVDSSKHGTLTVIVTRVRNTGGKVVVMVFRSGPLTSGAGMVASKAVAASPQGSRAVFEDLPLGPYAVVAYHDENGNGTLDLSGGGQPPSEGVGRSGRSGPLTGPPTFEDSRFLLDKDTLELTVPLFYY
jgi:uncharacterized protein (DUF2141 family)